MRQAHQSEDRSEDGKKVGTVETIERVFGDEKGVADVAETAMYVA